MLREPGRRPWQLDAQRKERRVGPANLFCGCRIEERAHDIALHRKREAIDEGSEQGGAVDLAGELTERGLALARSAYDQISLPSAAKCLLRHGDFMVVYRLVVGVRAAKRRGLPGEQAGKEEVALGSRFDHGLPRYRQVDEHFAKRDAAFLMPALLQPSELVARDLLREPRHQRITNVLTKPGGCHPLRKNVRRRSLWGRVGRRRLARLAGRAR